MMTEFDFDNLIDSLERDKKNDYNYRKLVKKFFRWYTNDDVPKWVHNIKMPKMVTPVQPSDLLTKKELEKLLAACEHPRDKAMIAVALDSSMRVGALGTLRIRVWCIIHMEQYYISVQQAAIQSPPNRNQFH